MRYLAEDATARSELGDDLGEEAHAKAASAVTAREKEIAVGYYRRALSEYQEALRLDPTFVPVLSRYGYTFWQWHLDWLRGRTASPPDQTIASRAEGYARAGKRIAHSLQAADSPQTTEGQQLTNMEMIVTDTLGEVLLAEGRPAEALQYLHAIVSSNPKWLGLNETRWDLAGAEICAARATHNSIAQRRLQLDAVRVLQDIRDDEENREFRPLTTVVGALDPHFLESICMNAR